jgi:FtsP/CotA-like multicopper oxidase with cupredoxin domain
MAHDDVKRRDVLRLASILVLGSAATGLESVAESLPESSAEPGAASLAICGDGETKEVFPTSPLILSPFTDPLFIPLPLDPVPTNVFKLWGSPPGPGLGQQDSEGLFARHQIWPAKEPLVYQIKLRVAGHSFTTSKVQPIDRRGRPVTPPRGSGRTGPPYSLPQSTIWGFNGQFPGPMIYARYGEPVLVRFENELGEVVANANFDSQDFGDPDRGFLTHLHNGHTAPESDGNPFYRPDGYYPAQWVDNLYLNEPAGVRFDAFGNIQVSGDEREKQSFFWFHDHRMDHTSAGVYKGMVGIYPIYDPIADPGDERFGLRLPGVPNLDTGRIDYDIPLVLYDCCLDDGVTEHQDFHSGCGETHPEWWGKTFFKHFPNKGFVGDLFTVNGTAYPVLHVKRRKYRFRFLDASVARIYDLKLMTGSPVAAPGKQGQFQLPDGQQCMRFVEIATDGGLLPYPILRDSFELWPAKRREVILDFTRYMDGSPTTPGDVIYLVNTAQMLNGRMPNGPLTEDDDDHLVPDPLYDPNYRVPIMKIVIGDVPTVPDYSLIPQTLRPLPALPANLNQLRRRTFEFERESLSPGSEWAINGRDFDPTLSLANVKKGVPEVWIIKNKGTGWVHPVHIHMEEHQVLKRDGRNTVAPPPLPNVANGQHVDDKSREDVVSLGPGEEVLFYRNFRTFLGRYVTHCHNLAHEDHAMMFGWTIV